MGYHRCSNIDTHPNKKILFSESFRSLNQLGLRQVDLPYGHCRLCRFAPYNTKTALILKISIDSVSRLLSTIEQLEIQISGANYYGV
jgi:hypothetical protein